MVVIVDKNQFEAVPEPSRLTVEAALKQTVDGGKIENLYVDAESLSFDNVGRFELFVRSRWKIFVLCFSNVS